ncbi:MAG: helix-turn-helix domain-containing protein [Elainella sp. Prado103]|jgi:transcriptional regulator with XRE-family HTH domain|nr:helix-turn-helix domain-containing protein [Elainella sp. Prado103]
MLDYTAQLRSLMQSANIASFRSLSQIAGISERQVERLRKGEIANMRLSVLIRLSQVFQQPIASLIRLFSETSIADPGLDPASGQELSEPSTFPALSNAQADEIQQLRQEYHRLQSQLQAQRLQLQQEFQRTSLNILESWLIFYPAAAYAAQQKPDVPAINLLPLMRPIEQLIRAWGVEMLDPVGSEVPFDPQYHQLEGGDAQPGDRVKIRKPGYRQGEHLLYRAKVTPVVEGNDSPS